MEDITWSTEDEYTGFGKMNIEGFDVPYFPIVFLDLNIIDRWKITYYIEETEYELLSLAVRATCGTYNNCDPTDEILFAYYSEDDSNWAPTRSSFIIPYIPFTRVRLFENWHDGQTIPHIYEFHWDHWEDGFSSTPSGTMQFKMSDYINKIDPEILILTRQSGSNYDNYVEVSTENLIYAQNGSDFSFNNSAYFTPLTIDSTPEELTNSPILQNLCTWCMELDSNYTGGWNISVCDTSCSLDSDLKEICKYMPAENDVNEGNPTGFLDTAICKAYCKETIGNCADTLLDMCATKSWNSNFVDAEDTAALESGLAEDIYCGCYLDNEQYTEWYDEMVEGKGLLPESGIAVTQNRCIFGGCVNGDYKFDTYNNCPSVEFCINSVTAGGDIIVVGNSNLIVGENSCNSEEESSSGSSSDSDSSDKELDFAGEHTLYIIIAVVGFLLLIIAYKLI